MGYFFGGITTGIAMGLAYWLTGPIGYPSTVCPEWVYYSGGTC